MGRKSAEAFAGCPRRMVDDPRNQPVFSAANHGKSRSNPALGGLR